MQVPNRIFGTSHAFRFSESLRLNPEFSPQGALQPKPIP